MRNAPVIYIVVPCYNEEEVLPLTAEFLGKKLDDLTRSRRIHPGSRVLMVDDGSKDRTWKLIEELHEKDERFAGVKLSRNRGHQELRFLPGFGRRDGGVTRRSRWMPICRMMWTHATR